MRQKTAALHIASNDADENPFDIVLTGSGAGPGVVDSFNPNIGGSTVYTAVMQSDGKMVIGGNFSSVGGLARGNIARFTANGAIEDNAGFGTGTGTNGDVFAITLQPDGKLVLGGGFTDVSGQSRQNVARVNANGAIDFGFSASLSSNAEVFGTAVQDSGSILLVGAFTNVNALLHNHIARVTTNGVPEIPATFETGAGANGIIYAVALQPDGKILIGGEFTTFNGQPRGYVARLEANGNAESAAAFSAATNGFVSAVAVQADGKIVIAGDFTTANGQPRGRIARLGADGALESTATFNQGAGADGPIYSLALQADGKLIVAGEFTSFSGEARGGVARLNTDGSLDGSAAFATGTGADGPVYGVTLQADGKVILCGTFTGVDGQARNHLARLSNDTAAQSLAATATTRVQWLRSGAAPEIEGVIFESSTNGWANWTTLGTGTRIAGGWERTGLNLSGIGQLRARGRVASGTFGGSQSIIEQVAAFDFLTQPPVLNLPATATVIAPPVNVSFSLPEAALPGSVQLTFDDGATPRVMTLAASRESAGAHAFAFDIANPTGSPEIASCPAIPEGTYSVTLRYQDAPGNASANSATATNVRVAATPLRAWKLAQLGDIEAPDLGDTDRDGLMHLIEYALMLSPTASSSPPKLTRFTYPEGQRLRMFFTRDPARSDVTIEIQSAPSIAGPWTTIAASTLGSVTTGPGYVGGDSAGAGVKTVEVRDTVNMSAANTRWMRVKVMR